MKKSSVGQFSSRLFTIVNIPKPSVLDGDRLLTFFLELPCLFWAGTFECWFKFLRITLCRDFQMAGLITLGSFHVHGRL